MTQDFELRTLQFSGATSQIDALDAEALRRESGRPRADPRRHRRSISLKGQEVVPRLLPQKTLQPQPTNHFYQQEGAQKVFVPLKSDAPALGTCRPGPLQELELQNLASESQFSIQNPGTLSLIPAQEPLI